MNVKPLGLLGVVGVALLPTALLVMTGGEDQVTGASIAQLYAPPANVPVAVAPSRAVTAATFAAPKGIATLATSVPLTSAASAEDEESAVRLTVTAPPFVEPGSTHELVVGIAAPRRARWVELTISADSDQVELRDATPSAWGGRRSTAPNFEARLGAAENRIVIRAEAGAETSGNETAGVVIVRFEGVSPGSATVTVSGVAVSDDAGNAIPVESPAAEAQIVVMSGPI